jgi:hypothetical protein
MSVSLRHLTMLPSSMIAALLPRTSCWLLSSADYHPPPCLGRAPATHSHAGRTVALSLRGDLQQAPNLHHAQCDAQAHRFSQSAIADRESCTAFARTIIPPSPGEALHERLEIMAINGCAASKNERSRSPAYESRAMLPVTRCRRLESSQ